LKTWFRAFAIQIGNKFDFPVTLASQYHFHTNILICLLGVKWIQLIEYAVFSVIDCGVSSEVGFPSFHLPSYHQFLVSIKFSHYSPPRDLKHNLFRCL